MKYLASIITLSVGFANAQSACNSLASAIPPCGLQCIISAGSSVGCASTDYACLCTSALQASSVFSAAQSCVLGACSATAIQVLTDAEAVCSCVSTASGAAKSASSTSPASASASMTTSSSASPASPVSTTSTPASTTTTSRTLTQIPPISNVSTVSSSLLLSTPAGTTSLPVTSISSSTSSVSTGGQGAVKHGLETGGSVLAALGALMALLW